MKYRGETDSKKAVRASLYTFARYWMSEWCGREASRSVNFSKGNALVIAGPEAGEAGCIRQLLLWPALRTVFVDTDEAGIRAAHVRMPGCSTFHGQFHRAAINKLAFVHLDLMGHFAAARESVACLRGKLLPGACLAFTFLRGRESGANWPLCISWAKGMAKNFGIKMTQGPEARRVIFDCARFHGYRKLIAAELGIPEAQLLTRMQVRYDSGRSPMGLLLLQFCPYRNDRIEKQARARGNGNFGRGLLMTKYGFESLPELNAKRAVRTTAFTMSKHYSSAQIADALNIKASTIVAWKAHETMGSYAPGPTWTHPLLDLLMRGRG